MEPAVGVEPTTLGENITDARRNAIAKSIREISVEALKSVGDSLLKARHTWIDPLLQLIEENAGNTFFHAKADDRIEIIYCRDKERRVFGSSAAPGSASCLQRI